MTKNERVSEAMSFLARISSEYGQNLNDVPMARVLMMLKPEHRSELERILFDGLAEIVI